MSSFINALKGCFKLDDKDPQKSYWCHFRFFTVEGLVSGVSTVSTLDKERFSGDRFCSDWRNDGTLVMASIFTAGSFTSFKDSGIGEIQRKTTHWKNKNTKFFIHQDILPVATFSTALPGN